MYRMLEIRARQLVRKEGYAVHVNCGSEAELARDSNNWTCSKCGRRVPRYEVADRLSASEKAGEDIRYLLDQLDGFPGGPVVDGQFGSTHGIAKFLLDGPDVPATLDYAPGLRVQANWTESSMERFNRYLAAEPDPNPPEED